MEAIILAGGLGTRLAGRLSGVPKAMAPIAGRPFLAILLQQLKRSGCSRVLLSVGYLHAAIEEHFGDSFDGMRLEYVVEAAPLGTGGAVRNALVRAREDAVMVLNGDTFLSADYAEIVRFHREQNAAMTMAITWQANIARYGGVLTSGNKITGFEEKGRSGQGWINAGVYVLPRDLFWPASLPERFSFETDFLMPEIGRIAPTWFEVKGFFLDIGVPEDLDRAQKELRDIDSSGAANEDRGMHCVSKVRTVFLDRDGVVNKKMPDGKYVRSWNDFQLLPGAIEAIAQLNRRNVRVIVVSNQRGIARKLYSVADVQAIHSRLQALLANHGARVDAFYICPHEEGECNCRKPLPGMFEQAVAEFPDISPATSVIIGDSVSDMEFGLRLGMKTILIEDRKERRGPGIEEHRALAGPLFPSLVSAVRDLVAAEPGVEENPS